MNDFLKILQYMNSAATKPAELLSRQASRHDKMRENRFGATHNQLHRYVAAVFADGASGSSLFERYNLERARPKLGIMGISVFGRELIFSAACQCQLVRTCQAK